MGKQLVYLYSLSSLELYSGVNYILYLHRVGYQSCLLFWQQLTALQALVTTSMSLFQFPFLGLILPGCRHFGLLFFDFKTPRDLQRAYWIHTRDLRFIVRLRQDFFNFWHMGWTSSDVLSHACTDTMSSLHVGRCLFCLFHVEDRPFIQCFSRYNH